MSATETGSFLFTWEIKNFSILLAKKEFKMSSPDFKTMTPVESIWRNIFMFTEDEKVRFKLFEKIGTSSNNIFQTTVINYICFREIPSQIQHSISTDAELDINNPSPLHDDILTVGCSIWSKTLRSGNFKIQTVLNKESFIWKIVNFYPKSNYSSYIEKENIVFKIFLKFNEDQKTYRFQVEELPNLSGRLSFVYIKPSIDSVLGKITDDFCESESIKRWEIELFERKNVRNIFEIRLDTIYAIHKELSDSTASPKSVKNVVEPKTTVSKSSGRLTKDLLTLYKDALHSDATLRTEGKSFPVHKAILSTRSDVFRAMFEKEDMKEGKGGVVVIDDLDSETVDRMLVFLYGDALGDVSWADASKLYYAADKYAIFPLKQKCAEIVKAGLSVHNACDALVLADRHSDQDLMDSTVEYILSHKEVISCPEWEKLEETHSRLTSKITKQILLKKWVN